MLLKRFASLVVLFLFLTTPSTAVELRFKYEKGQTRTMKVKINLKGNLDVSGAARLVGSAQGTAGATINMKTVDVDDKGVATIENKLEGFGIQLESNAELNDGSHSYIINLTQDGGTVTADGQTMPVPAGSLEDPQAQGWTTRMDTRGAQIGMNLQGANPDEKQAADIQQLSDSITKLTGNSGVLPEGDVSVGHTWEQTFRVDDITKGLSNENPMLSTITNLGIPDLTTKFTFTDLREEGGNQIATIDSTTQFEWTNGNLPLGIVNVTVNRLAITSESLIDVNNTEGYAPRTTGVTTLDFDVVINLPLGPEGPSVYNAKGQVRADSEILLE